MRKIIVFCSILLNLTANSQYSKLVDFSGSSNGGSPFGTPVISGSILYGMTYRGGINDKGIVYKVNTDGSGFTKLVEFDGTNKGSNPFGSLVVSGSVLYGMTFYGGLNNMGVAFKVNTDGTNFSKLIDFDGATKGRYPYSSFILSGSVLYGTTCKGGINNYGTVFKINTDGSGFTKLVDLDTFNLGNNPRGVLAISGSVLYGMTSTGGGAFGEKSGTIFKVNTDGSGFTKLIEFDFINKGATPQGSLIVLGSVLYGMTSGGGANDKGVIFKINTDGTGFSKMINFGDVNDANGPYGSLVLSGNMLYGMTKGGGTSYKGTIFKIKTDGTGYSKIHDLDGTNGSFPYGDLSQDGNVFYGMTYYGGANNMGVIFKYTTLTTQISNLTCSDITTKQVKIKWKNGNGDSRVVFMKKNGGSITNPVNNTTYTASSDWTNLGTQLGTSGYYCIYNGCNDSIIVENLTPSTSYSVQAFEYNGLAGAEQYLTISASGNPVTFVTKSPPSATICMVKYDVSERKNMIVWEREKGLNIKAYKILRQKTTTTYDTIGTVPFDIANTFYIDSLIDPNVQSMRYKICSVDSLNRRSMPSPFHKTMNLSKSQGVSAGEIILSWNEYEDSSKVFVPSNYHIFRDHGTGTLIFYTNQAAGSPYYSVNAYGALPGEMFQIVVDKDPACNASLPYKADIGPYTQSLSNIVEYKFSGIKIDKEISAVVYPNPFNNEMTLNLCLQQPSDIRIELSNNAGMIEYSKQYTSLLNGFVEIKINTESLPISSGIHFLRIISEESVTLLKCIKE